MQTSNSPEMSNPESNGKLDCNESSVTTDEISVLLEKKVNGQRSIGTREILDKYLVSKETSTVREEADCVNNNTLPMSEVDNVSEIDIAARNKSVCSDETIIFCDSDDHLTDIECDISPSKTRSSSGFVTEIKTNLKGTEKSTDTKDEDKKEVIGSLTAMVSMVENSLNSQDSKPAKKIGNRISIDKETKVTASLDNSKSNKNSPEKSSIPIKSVASIVELDKNSQLVCVEDGNSDKSTVENYRDSPVESEIFKNETVASDKNVFENVRDRLRRVMHEHSFKKDESTEKSEFRNSAEVSIDRKTIISPAIDSIVHRSSRSSTSFNAALDVSIGEVKEEKSFSRIVYRERFQKSNDSLNNNKTELGSSPSRNRSMDRRSKSRSRSQHGISQSNDRIKQSRGISQSSDRSRSRDESRDRSSRSRHSSRDERDRHRKKSKDKSWKNDKDRSRSRDKSAHVRSKSRDRSSFTSTSGRKTNNSLSSYEDSLSTEDDLKHIKSRDISEDRSAAVKDASEDADLKYENNSSVHKVDRTRSGTSSRSGSKDREGNHRRSKSSSRLDASILKESSKPFKTSNKMSNSGENMSVTKNLPTFHNSSKLVDYDEDFLNGNELPDISSSDSSRLTDTRDSDRNSNRESIPDFDEELIYQSGQASLSNLSKKMMPKGFKDSNSIDFKLPNSIFGSRKKSLL